MKHLFYLFSIFLFGLFQFIAVAQTTYPQQRFVDWRAAGCSTFDISGFQLIDLGSIGLDPTGQNDCSSLLNQLILAHQNDSIVLQFPAGVFKFGASLQLHSNVVLQGAGAQQTILRFDLSQQNSAIVASGSVSATTLALAAIPVKGQTKLICQNHAFQNGDWLRLQCNDSSLVTSNWALGTVGQLVQILNVDQDTIFLKSPLRRTYINDGPVYIQKVVPLEHIGMSCFGIERIDDTAPAQQSNIQLNFVVNSYLSHLSSINCTFAHVDLRTCSNITVRASYFQDAFNYGGGGRAYGVALQATTNECLIEDNIFKHLRHAILLQSGANGNVAALNFSTEPNWDEPPFTANAAGELVLHGNYVYANLFEQNVIGNIVIDNSHGANGPDNLFYRNRAELYGIFFSDQSSPQQLFIGNHITNTSFPYSLVNYNLQGVGHYQFANNNKGVITPSGTQMSSDTSFAYQTKPDFISAIDWLTIGDQPTMIQPIPAQQRYLNQTPFYMNCNQGAVSNAEQLLNSFSVWPIPFEESCWVKAPGHVGGCLSILNVSGQVLKKISLNQEQQCLELQDLAPGIYFLRIAETTEAIRIIKN